MRNKHEFSSYTTDFDEFNTALKHLQLPYAPEDLIRLKTTRAIAEHLHLISSQTAKEHNSASDRLRRAFWKGTPIASEIPHPSGKTTHSSDIDNLIRQINKYGLAVFKLNLSEVWSSGSTTDPNEQTDLNKIFAGIKAQCPNITAVNVHGASYTEKYSKL